MKKIFAVSGLFLGIFVFCFILRAAEIEMNKKCSRCLGAILKKKKTGNLFDYFYESWLAENTPDELEAYLSSKYKETSNPVYLELLGCFYEKRGKDEKALSVYERMLKLGDGAAGVYLKKASLEMYLQYYGRAAEDLKKALSCKPSALEKKRIMKLLGKVLVKSGEQEEGLKVWRELVKASPGDEDLIDDLMALQLQENLFDEAEKLCKEALEKTNNNFRKYSLSAKLGNIRHLKGEREKALDSYRKALDFAKGGSWLESEILSRIEDVFMSENDIPGLMEYYEKVILPKRKDPCAQKKYAKLLFDNDRKEKSLETLKALVEKTPLSSDNKELYASYLEKSGELKEAVKILNRLIEQNGNSAGLYFKKANLELELNEAGSAMEAVQKYLELNKFSEGSYLRAADLMKNAADIPKTLQLYDEMASKHPESIEPQLNKALFMHNNNKKDEAKKILFDLEKKCKTQDAYRLCAALRSMNEKEEALKFLKSRKEALSGEPKYWEELYLLAVSTGKLDEALDAAKTLVGTAKNAYRLSNAISCFIHTAEKLKKLDEITDKLLKNKDLSVNETCLLVEILRQQSLQEKALSVLKDALSKIPDSEILMNCAVDYYLKVDKKDAALDQIDELISKFPRKQGLYMRRAIDLSMKTGKDKKALEYIVRWKRISPALIEPYLLEARHYKMQNKREDALKVLSKARNRFRDNNEIKEALAQCYAGAGDFNSAENIYWESINTEKTIDGKLAFFQKIMDLAKLSGRRARVLRELQKRREKNVSGLFPLLALSRYSRSVYDLTRAREYLLKAHSLQKNNPSLLYDIAEMEEADGLFDKALATLKKAAEMDKTGKAEQKIISYYFRNGEDEKAYEALFNKDSLKTSSASGVISAGLSILNSSQPEMAGKYLKGFCVKYPDNPRVEYLYACALEESNDISGALELFLELISLREKQNSKPQASLFAGLLSGRRYYVDSSLPQEAANILCFPVIVDTAYSYRRPASMYNRRYMMSGGAYSTSSVPSDIETLKIYSLCHLLKLSGSLEEERRKDILRKISQKGVKYADIMSEAAAGSRSRISYNQSFWSEKLKLYPDDEIIQYLWVNSFNTQTPKEDIKKGLSLFKKKNPDFALKILYKAAWNKNLFDKEFAREALNIVKSRSPLDLDVNQCLAFLKSDKFSNEERLELERAAMDAYKKKSKAGALKPYEFLSAFSSLVNLGCLKSAAEIVEIEMKNPNPTASSFGRYYNPYSRVHASRNPVTPLRIDYISIGSLPMGVLNVLSRRASANKSKFWKVFEHIKNTPMRLALAAACGKDKEFDETAKEIMERRPPDKSELMLLALEDAKKCEKQKCLDALSALLALPLSRAERKMINGAIIYYILGSGGKDEKDRELLKTSVENILKTRLSADEKKSLANILSNSGNLELAESVRKTIPKSAVLSSLSSRRGWSRSSMRVIGLSQRMEDFLSKGEKEKALSVILAEYRKNISLAIRELRNSPSNAGYMFQHKFEEIFNILKNNKSLKNDFLSALKKAASSESLRRLAELAFALEKLGDKQEAVKIYLGIYKKNSSDCFAVVRLLALRPFDKALQAGLFKALMKLSRNNPDAAANFFQNGFYNAKKVSEKLDFLESCFAFFKYAVRQPGFNKNNFQSYSAMLGHIPFERLQDNEVILKGIFEPDSGNESDAEKKLSEKIKKLEARRDKIMYDACDLCMSFSSAPFTGFGVKLFILRRNSMPCDEMHDAALDIIAKNKNAKLEHLNGQRMKQHRQRTTILESPLEFAIVSAFEKNKTEDLKKFFSENNLELAAFLLESADSLMKCEEKDFASNVDSFLASEKLREDPGIIPEYFNIAFKIRKARKFKVGLAAQVIRAWRLILELRSQDYSNSRLLTCSFLDDCDEGWTSPKDVFEFYRQGVELLKKKRLQTSSVSGVPVGFNNQQIPISYAAYRQLLEAAQKALEKDPNLVFQALLLENRELPSAYKNHNQLLCRQKAIIDRINQNAHVFDFVKRSPFLNDFKDFSPLEFKTRQGWDSVYLQMMESLRNKASDTALVQKLLERLKKEKKNFGVALFSAFLMAENKTDVFDALSSHLDEIKQASPEKQEAFFRFLNEALVKFNLVDCQTISEGKSGKFKNYFENFLSRKNKDEYDRLISEGLTYQNQDKYINDAIRLISQLAASDPQKARDLLKDAMKKMALLNLASGGGIAGRSNYMQRRFINRLFNGIRGNLNGTLSMMEALEQLDGLSNSDKEYVVRRMGGSFRNIIDEKVRRSHDNARYKAVRDVIVDSGKLWKGRKTPLAFSRALADFVEGMSYMELKSLARFIESDSNTLDERSSEYIRLAVLKAIAVHDSNDVFNRKKFAGELKKFINNKEYPLEDRAESFARASSLWGRKELSVMMPEAILFFAETEKMKPYLSFRNSYSSSQLLEAFCAADRSDAWKQAAKIILEKFDKNLPEIKRRLRSRNNSDREEQILKNILILCLGTDDKENFNALLADKDFDLCASPALYAALLECGENEKCREFFIKNWTKLKYSKTNLPISGDAGKNAASVINSIKEPDSKFAAKAFFASMPTKLAPGRGNRLKDISDLISAFKYLKTKSDEPTRKALLFLQSHSSSYERLRDFYAELYRSIPPDKLNLDAINENFYAKFLVDTLKSGDSKEFIEICSKLSENQKKQLFYRAQGCLRQELCRQPPPDGIWKLPLDKLIHVERLLAENLGSDRMEGIFAVVALYCAAGKQDEALKFIKSFDLQKLQRNAQLYYLENSFKIYLKATKAKDAAKNSNFLSCKAIELIFEKKQDELKKAKMRCIQASFRDLKNASPSFLLKKLKSMPKENCSFDEFAMMAEMLKESDNKSLQKKRREFRRSLHNALTSWLMEIAEEPEDPPFSRGSIYSQAFANLGRADAKNVLSDVRERLAEGRTVSMEEAEIYLAQTAEPEKALSKAEDFFKKISSDENVPEEQKFFFYANYLLYKKDLFKKMPEVADKCVKIFLPLAKEQKPDEKYFYDVLRIYNMNALDDNWPVGARILCDFWDKNYSENMKHIPLSAAVGLLEMRLKLGQVDKAKSLLETHDKLTRYPQAYIPLIHYKQYELLADIFKKNRGKLTVCYTYPFIYRFSPDLMRKIQECKPFLKDDDLKYEFDLFIKAFAFYNSHLSRRNVKLRLTSGNRDYAVILPAAYYEKNYRGSYSPYKKKRRKDFTDFFAKMEPDKIKDLQALSGCIKLGWETDRLPPVKEKITGLASVEGFMEKLNSPATFDSKIHCLEARLQELYRTQDFKAVFALFNEEKDKIRKGCYKDFDKDSRKDDSSRAYRLARGGAVKCIMNIFFDGMKDFMLKVRELKDPPPLEGFKKMAEFISEIDNSRRNEAQFFIAGIICLENKPGEFNSLLESHAYRNSYYIYNFFAPFNYAIIASKDDKRKLEIFGNILKLFEEKAVKKALNLRRWNILSVLKKYPFFDKNPELYEQKMLEFYKDSDSRKKYIEKYYKRLKERKR